MNEIIVLDVEFEFGETKDVIHPVILLDSKEMVLVDCGYTGFLSNIEEAMEKVKLDCNRLTKVVITHHDHDHMGALSALKNKYPHVQVVASELEAPYISGIKKSMRLEQAEEMQKYLPDEQKAFGEIFCNILRNVAPANVDILVKNGDIFDWCGGCEVVATPGHTKGHISLYLKDKKTIITGDAAVVDNNQLVIANPQFAFNIEQAEEALANLIRFDADTYICYHGGIFKDYF